MPGDVLVQAVGVRKKFCRSFKRSLWYGLQDMASEVLGRQAGHDCLRPDEFWAVDDVSFELRRGECLGLIGHNGAGKTTLLKMLNGLIRPDQGRISMRGRVGALIALGAGFNPILTGRENIYVNGSVLGLTKAEIDAQIDEIIDFAEMRDFIDAPVQSYSSGMAVRLGFAVATAIEPDVLLLDEVLAVGDAAFRTRCYHRLGALQKRAAVIFVSHSMNQVGQFCTRGLYLEKGAMLVCGDVRQAITAYNTFTREHVRGESHECAGAVVKSYSIKLSSSQIAYGETLDLEIAIESSRAIAAAYILIYLYDLSGAIVAEYNSAQEAVKPRLAPGRNLIRRPFGPLLLRPAQYSLGIWIQEMGSIDPVIWSNGKHSFTVSGKADGFCAYQLR